MSEARIAYHLRRIATLTKHLKRETDPDAQSQLHARITHHRARVAALQEKTHAV